MPLIKRKTTHFEVENNGALLSADRTVTKICGISLKSEFNATITDKSSGKFLMGLTHTTASATGMSVQQAIDYQARIVDAFKKNGIERIEGGGTGFAFPRP